MEERAVTGLWKGVESSRSGLGEREVVVVVVVGGSASRMSCRSSVSGPDISASRAAKVAMRA